MEQFKRHFVYESVISFLVLVLFTVDGLPDIVGNPTKVCQYYDPVQCRNDQNDCNKTIDVCEGQASNKRFHCYALFVKNSSSGILALEKKGCWLDSDVCYNETKCIAKDDSGQGHFYCCCEGNMCNVNITFISSSYKVLPTVPNKVIVPHESAVFKTLMCSIVPLIILAILIIGIFLVWRCRQPDYIVQLEAAGDKPLLACSPPTPLPIAALKSIKLLEEKARGRFGRVYKAQMGNELVAVKVFPVHDRHSWSIEHEIYNLPHINNHSNILKFIAAEKREDFWLITEFHQRGSLYDHLKGNTVNWNEARRIMLSMVQGLSFLHSTLPNTDMLPAKPLIAHRDLKSRNVLLKDDMTACLADFGLALVLDANMDSVPGQVGTHRYMAPEVLDGSITMTPIFMLKIDIYAFALILWEIMSRCTAVKRNVLKEYELPFQHELGDHPTMEEMQEAVVNKKLRPLLDPDMCQNEDLELISTTIEDCWDHDPEARLTAECIYERLNRTSIYLSFLENSTCTLPASLHSKDQLSTSSSSVDDLSLA